MDMATKPSDVDSSGRDQALEERTLFAALAAGDRRAAEQLVEHTYSRVFASVLKMCGRLDLAADLTQDTYRKAWASLDRFDRRSLFSTWLYRIAYNTFLNHVRRPARIVATDPLQLEERCDPHPGPDERMDRSEARERLRRAVIALPEELRFTITARFWGELPVKEIARLENVTGAAIRKRLKKAMAGLRHTLGEDIS